MTKKKKWSLLVIAGLIAIGVLAALAEEVDWRGLRHSMETMDRGPLLVLLAVLPIFGFSVAVAYLIVGAVFGGWLGLAVVGGMTAVHLLGGHWIARSFLRRPLLHFLRRRKHQLPEVPEGGEKAVALMTVLVPGLPYFVRNHLLALSGIPLRTYFWICWPVYVIRSGLVIMLGDFSGGFTGRRVILLGAVLVVKVGICGFLLYRLRARQKSRRGVSHLSARDQIHAGDRQREVAARHVG